MIDHKKPNSQWLGPKTRKRLFGSEDGGTPRPGGNVSSERKGFFRGARGYR